jgi:protein-S-isoprenylcysteine O-methyltransferase Ste14
MSIQHDLFRLLYLIGYVVAWGARLPHALRARRSAVADNRKTRLETLLLALLFAGTLIVPLVYVSSPWLDPADYALPAWAGVTGTTGFGFAVMLLCSSHAVLGRNWSPTLQIRQEHRLVVEGPYRWVRHPIYAAHWLWALSQPLLLQNWIAGFSALAVVAPLYLLRVSREESMMLERFGEEYRAYMARTGRLIPRLR